MVRRAASPTAGSTSTVDRRCSRVSRSARRCRAASVRKARSFSRPAIAWERAGRGSPGTARSPRGFPRSGSPPGVPSSPGQLGSLLANTLGVVAEGLVKGGEFADAAVDQVAAFGIVEREEIGFHGHPHRRRGVGELSQDRLAADHHDRVVGGDDRRRTNQVLELLAGHGREARRSRVSRQIAQRSRGLSAPAKGLDWRSSSASSLRSIRKVATEEGSPARTSAHLRA